MEAVMVAKRSIYSQLRAIGLRFKIYGRAEVQQLHSILLPGEIIQHCVYGYYIGGSGLLVATTERLLLIDKRPLYLHLEELSYDSIDESLIRRKLLQATFFVRSGKKRLKFRSLSDARMKQLYRYVQKRQAEAERDIRDSIAVVKQVNNGFVQHPAWRPHAPHMLRRRPGKFHKRLGQVART